MNYRMLLVVALVIGALFFYVKKEKQSPHIIPQPSVVCVIVIDQLAAYHLQHLYPHFKGGFKKLIDEGFAYQNAHFYTAVPGTAPDHTTLSTGAWASVHGIVANGWFNEQNKLIPAEQDNEHPTFAGNGKKISGASAHNIMADTLSDQVMLASTPENPNVAVAVSVKARAAIGCAGRNGKALWFNEKTGDMTSSTAYFDELPDWITTFNKKYNPLQQDTISVTWKPFYQNSKAYDEYIQARTGYKPNKELYNTTITLKENGQVMDKDLTEFERTPLIDTILFAFAKECFDYYKPTPPSKYLFWFSVSTLDKIGHALGPWSIDAIDYLYHLDSYLLDFIEHVQKSVGKEKAFFILTADHGTIQIPELVNTAPVPLGHRVYTKTLRKNINESIKAMYGIDKALIGYQAPGFYLNRSITDEKQKEAIAREIKKTLIKEPSIKRVWTEKELIETCDKSAQPYKNQFYPGRSPDIICEPQPYALITKDPIGIDHASPYNYDTQVPLIFYWPAHLPIKQVYKPVSMTHVARTLSLILDVPAPSAAAYGVLSDLLQLLEKQGK